MGLKESAKFLMSSTYIRDLAMLVIRWDWFLENAVCYY
jgi:ATP/ADP translocase